MKTIELSVITDDSGDGSASVNLAEANPELAQGALLYAVEWNVGTFATGVDATVTTTSAWLHVLEA